MAQIKNGPSTQIFQSTWVPVSRRLTIVSLTFPILLIPFQFYPHESSNYGAYKSTCSSFFHLFPNKNRIHFWWCLSFFCLVSTRITQKNSNISKNGVAITGSTNSSLPFMALKETTLYKVVPRSWLGWFIIK